MSYYRQQLEDYLKLIEVNADLVVDIGGAANPVKNRVGIWNVKKYIILDNEIEGKKGDYKYDLNEDGVPEIDGHFLVEKADFVFCLEVFEYVYDTKQAILNLWSMLKFGGKALITFPFVYPYHQPTEYDYLRYTLRGVKKLLEFTGFSKYEIIERKDKSGLLQSFYAADGMHPAKSYRHDMTGFIVVAVK